MQITPNSLKVSQLLSAEGEQYIVPAYQRRYSWHKKQLWELVDDIGLLEGADTHLLGSIVCLAGYHTSGINKLEVVDGQQRLTTICILLQCIADRLIKEGETSPGEELNRLLQARALGELPVRKVLLDSLDAAQFEQHLNGEDPITPRNEHLATAFDTLRGWTKKKKLQDLGTFLYRLKNQCVVIRLDVSDAKDAFKLFETINNRGLKLSSADIIKNFILGNAARFGSQHLEVARGKWSDLLGYLDGMNIESFFRHFLCARLQRRITISFVVPEFKSVFMREVKEADRLPERHWYDEYIPSEEDEDDEGDTVDNSDEEDGYGEDTSSKYSFAQFLSQIVDGARNYRDIVSANTGIPKVDHSLSNLRRIKFAQSYGFLMSLRAGGCSDNDFASVLELTEAFLIRRHICRERANENETLFSKLCGIDKTNPLPQVKEDFRRLSPADERFRHEFANFDFGSSLIDRARYCLEQFELERHGSDPEVRVAGPDSVHVEHIIPSKIKTRRAREEFGDWPTYLGYNSIAMHSHYVSRIGNMTLLSAPLNIGASNNPFHRKREAYMKSSLEVTTEISNRYSDFRFEQVIDRSSEFSDLALNVWPIP